jgi:hypothetical protein
MTGPLRRWTGWRTKLSGHMDLLRPVTMLIGNVPLRDLAEFRDIAVVPDARIRSRINAARGNLGEASRASRTPWRDAILQPPKPQITPSAEILQLAAEHDIEPEAGG